MTEAGWTRKCVESVWTGLGNGHGLSQQCGRTGKVQHEGRWYCGMHSPEAKAKRKAKSDAHYQQYREKMDAKYAREDFDRRAGDALRAMNITDPQTLTDSYQQGRVAGLRDSMDDLRKRMDRDDGDTDNDVWKHLAWCELQIKAQAAQDEKPTKEAL